jgi:type II secretory pathway pseudopilin PulG
MSGFTLLEMVAVIGLIAALSGIVIGFGRHAVEASHGARAQTELAALATALDEYQRICGDYPRTNDESRLLQTLIGRRSPSDETIAIPALIEVTRFAVENESDPFSDSTAALIDPWGRRYRYAYKTLSPWSNSSYVLYSTGPDGRDSPALLAGGFVDRAPVENTDNVYANQSR